MRICEYYGKQNIEPLTSSATLSPRLCVSAHCSGTSEDMRICKYWDKQSVEPLSGSATLNPGCVFQPISVGRARTCGSASTAASIEPSPCSATQAASAPWPAPSDTVWPSPSAWASSKVIGIQVCCQSCFP